MEDSTNIRIREKIGRTKRKPTWRALLRYAGMRVDVVVATFYMHADRAPQRPNIQSLGACSNLFRQKCREARRTLDVREPTWNYTARPLSPDWRPLLEQDVYDSC